MSQIRINVKTKNPEKRWGMRCDIKYTFASYKKFVISSCCIIENVLKNCEASMQEVRK